MPKVPGVAHKRAIEALKKAGFRIIRNEGHVTMTDGKKILVIPRHNPVNAHTMGRIVKDAGLSVEEFKSLL